MPRTRALYSVVQYVPDGARAEGANAGVVLFVPESGAVRVKMSPGLDRVKKFFAPTKPELHRIAAAVRSLEHRLRTAQREFGSEDEFAHFIAARADAVRLTPPRVLVLSDLDPKLDELYARLVGGPPGRTRAGRGVSLPPRVAEVFGRLEAARRVWRPGRVPVPETNRRLEIPLAYKNGRVNYVLPQSLSPADRPEDRLPKLGFHGLLIHRHKIGDEPGRLVVLSADQDADREIERHYAEVLDDFRVRFIPHAEAEAFAAEVEQTAH